MARNIYVVSDTHFGHRNILTFLDEHGKHFRDFSSVEEMDELMVQNWNKAVTPQDIVYHLGDVYFGDGYKHLSRLNGHLRLILGNHDDGKDERLQKRFEKIMMWRMLPKHRVVLSHVPLDMTSFQHPDSKVDWNLHGHIHEKASPTPAHINCSVEVQDYTPKLLETLVPKS